MLLIINGFDRDSQALKGTSLSQPRTWFRPLCWLDELQPRWLFGEEENGIPKVNDRTAVREGRSAGFRRVVVSIARPNIGHRKAGVRPRGGAVAVK